MCLSLEHQNLSKTSENMADFDRVTVSLHILCTANQETEGSQDRLTVTRHFMPRSPFGRRAVRHRGYGLRLLIQNGEQQSRSGSDKKRRNRLQYLHDPTSFEL